MASDNRFSRNMQMMAMRDNAMTLFINCYKNGENDKNDKLLLELIYYMTDYEMNYCLFFLITNNYCIYEPLRDLYLSVIRQPLNTKIVLDQHKNEILPKIPLRLEKYTWANTEEQRKEFLKNNAVDVALEAHYLGRQAEFYPLLRNIFSKKPISLEFVILYLRQNGRFDQVLENMYREIIISILN